MKKQIRTLLFFMFFSFACISFTGISLAASSPNSFKDLPKDAWYYSPMFRLTQVGGIKGFEDGSIRPNHTITRAEFITMLLASNGEKKDVQNSPNWFYPFYLRALELKLLDPADPTDFFQPIKRQEMAILLCSFLNLSIEAEKIPVFIDVQTDSGIVDTVYRYHLIKGYEIANQRRFMPFASLSRAEAATVVINAYDYKQDPKGFMAGISASSRKYEKIPLYSFDLPILGKNSKLYAISPIQDSESKQGFEIVMILDKDANRLQLQLEDVREILSQRFDSGTVDSVLAYLRLKSHPNHSLPSQAFVSSDKKYTATVSSRVGSVFLLIRVVNTN